MQQPEQSDWDAFNNRFTNPNGLQDWITDREKLFTKLLTLTSLLNSQPETYRELSRSLMKYAHRLDTLLKGGGFFELAMNGRTDVPFCFAKRCDLIRDELIRLSRELAEASSQNEKDYVSLGVECLCVQIGRLSLCRVGGAGDPDAEARDGLMEEARVGILRRWYERRWDVLGLWKRFWKVWVSLERGFEGCDCYQCMRWMDVQDRG